VNSDKRRPPASQIGGLSPLLLQPDSAEPPGEAALGPAGALAPPNSAQAESERLRWQQAALWRGVVGEYLRTAADRLTMAVSCSPTSLEKVQAQRALKATLKALATCDAGNATARARMERELPEAERASREEEARQHDIALYERLRRRP
jgi:hypothetical protein